MDGAFGEGSRFEIPGHSLVATTNIDPRQTVYRAQKHHSEKLAERRSLSEEDFAIGTA